jgi:hypothetical protein
MKICHFCGTQLDDQEEVFRHSACISCGRDLKICYNCRFYSKGSHNDCLETSAEPVRDKDRANFCDYFVFKDSRGTEKQSAPSKDRRKEDFLKLFGDGD